DPFVGQRAAAVANLLELLAQWRVAVDAPLERPVLVLALEDGVGPGPAVPARGPIGVRLRVAAATRLRAQRGARRDRQAGVDWRQPMREQIARSCARTDDRRDQTGRPPRRPWRWHRLVGRDGVGRF